MENIISPAQVELIKERIQEELTKRGIHAPITTFEEYENTHSICERKIKLKTAEFQTIPVIFKKLRVESFSTNIEKVETTEKVGAHYHVYISLHYSYEHFGGGTNGCVLFGFGCKLFKGSDNNIYAVQID
jgi:hypothetical protein